MASKAYQIKQYLLAHPTVLNRVVAKLFNTSKDYVTKCRRGLKAGNMSLAPGELPRQAEFIPKTLDVELIERQRQAIINDLKARNKELAGRYEELNQKFDEVLALKVETPVKVAKIDLAPSKLDQAVAIVQFSDWHVEERVELSVMDGLNEYNPDIAKARSQAVTKNTLKLLTKEQQDVKISEMVVWLGGDFINNFIHDSYKQQNFLSPIEAVMFAKELLKTTLVTLAEYAGLKRIIVMCTRGNHGRLTYRMEAATDYKMNLESMLYHILKQELAVEPFEWHVPESELGYVEIYGKKIRCFHGHQVSYQGGVGDITVPVNKLIQKWDKTKKADWNLMGHYHRAWMVTQNCSLNGSLIGFNNYALSIGATFEPPAQVFQLLDAKRGFTVRCPIYCE